MARNTKSIKSEPPLPKSDRVYYFVMREYGCVPTILGIPAVDSKTARLLMTLRISPNTEILAITGTKPKSLHREYA